MIWTGDRVLQRKERPIPSVVKWLLRLGAALVLGLVTHWGFLEFYVSPEEKRHFLWKLNYIEEFYFFGIVWFLIVAALTQGGHSSDSD